MQDSNQPFDAPQTDQSFYDGADPHGPRKPTFPLIAWLLAIALTALAFAANHLPEPESSGPPTDPAQADTLPLRIAANQVMAIDALSSMSNASGSGGWGGAMGSPAQLIDQIEEQAATPLEHLRAAMLAASLDPEAAQSVLDNFDKSTTESLTKLDPDTDAEEIDYLNALRADADQLRALLTDGHSALTQDQRDALITRHKRYARIALLHDNPDRKTLDDPLHAKGINLAIAAVSMLSLAALGFIAGIVLFILAIIQTFQGKMTWRFAQTRGPAPAQTNAFLETYPLFMLCFLAVSILGGILASTITSAIPLTSLIIWPLLLCALWPRARAVSGPDLRAALGWHTNHAGFLGLIKESFLGVVGYCAGLPIVAAGLIITLVAITIQAKIAQAMGTEAAPPSHPGIESMLDGTLASTIALYTLACLWAPIVEETIFRGALFAHVRRGWHPILAAVVTAFLFAIIHPQGIAATPALMSLGVVFALIREWRGSIVGPMVAHALNNFVLITVLLTATA